MKKGIFMKFRCGCNYWKNINLMEAREASTLNAQKVEDDIFDYEIQITKKPLEI
jgi:hypothetical protein